MTLIGKLLAFVNLVVAIGILSWSASVYAMRPTWFDPAPDAVDKGSDPRTFAQIKADVDTLARAAAAASAAWGTELKVLENLEATRSARQKRYAERLNWAHNGNPADNGTGFYEPVYQPDGLLDLAKLGPPIKGSNDLPLKGADTLGKTFSADVAEVVKYAKDIDARRKEFAALGVRILQTEARKLKMNEIRDAVQAELFFLSSFEVNVYETRETVFRRKRQLVSRLAELGR